MNYDPPDEDMNQARWNKEMEAVEEMSDESVLSDIKRLMPSRYNETMFSLRIILCKYRDESSDQEEEPPLD